MIFFLKKISLTSFFFLISASLLVGEDKLANYEAYFSEQAQKSLEFYSSKLSSQHKDLFLKEIQIHQQKESVSYSWFLSFHMRLTQLASKNIKSSVQVRFKDTILRYGRDNDSLRSVDTSGHLFNFEALYNNFQLIRDEVELQNYGFFLKDFKTFKDFVTYQYIEHQEFIDLATHVSFAKNKICAPRTLSDSVRSFCYNDITSLSELAFHYFSDESLFFENYPDLVVSIRTDIEEGAEDFLNSFLNEFPVDLPRNIFEGDGFLMNPRDAYLHDLFHTYLTLSRFNRNNERFIEDEYVRFDIPFLKGVGRALIQAGQQTQTSAKTSFLNFLILHEKYNLLNMYFVSKYRMDHDESRHTYVLSLYKGLIDSGTMYDSDFEFDYDVLRFGKDFPFSTGSEFCGFLISEYLKLLREQVANFISSSKASDED